MIERDATTADMHRHISSSAAGEVLAAAMHGSHTTKTPDRRAELRDLIDRLNAAGDTPLIEWLIAEAAADRTIPTTEAIGRAARLLAPDGTAPVTGHAAEVWLAFACALDRLHGNGVQAIGRLSFMSDELFGALCDEARTARPAPASGARRATGEAGDILAAVAVSRELREVVSAALGAAAVPTYHALYEYDGPGSFVAPHVDARDYPFVVHLLLEHTRADRPAQSVLLAYSPDRLTPHRIPLSAMEAIVLNGRGTLHCWERLGMDEQRTLVAIGFAQGGGKEVPDEGS